MKQLLSLTLALFAVFGFAEFANASSIHHGSKAHHSRKAHHGDPYAFAPKSSTELYRWLWYGVEGSEARAQVRIMQLALMKAGYSVGPRGADGKFGSYTQSALRAFQDKHGIEAKGRWAGDRTAMLLNPIIHPTVTNRFITPMLRKFSANMTKVQDFVFPPEPSYSVTVYNRTEKGCDIDTKSGFTASGTHLNFSSETIAGDCAVNPEIIALGSRVTIEHMVKTKKGLVSQKSSYVASDIGWGVLHAKATKGFVPIIDIFGYHELTGTITIEHYSSNGPFETLPYQVKKQFFVNKNWKTGTLSLPPASGHSNRPIYASKG